MIFFKNAGTAGPDFSNIMFERFRENQVIITPSYGDTIILNRHQIKTLSDALLAFLGERLADPLIEGDRL